MPSRYDDRLTEEQKEARQKVHVLLSELADLIGPAGMMDIEDFGDNEEVEPPPTGVFLNEWVLVINWTSVDDGESYITRLGSENMPIHHRTGLLYEALNSFQD